VIESLERVIESLERGMRPRLRRTYARRVVAAIVTEDHDAD